MTLKTKSTSTFTTFAREATVPTFSDALIYIADLCAREAWIGNSYRTGKKKKDFLTIEKMDDNGEIKTERVAVTISDEILLMLFSTELLRKAGLGNIQTPYSGNSITLDNFRVLVNAAQLAPAINTKKSKLDIPNGLNYLTKNLVKQYKTWLKSRHKVIDPHIGRQMVKELSGELCLKENGIPIGNQTAVSSRLLNFGFPDLKVYIYSTEIHRGLRLSDTINSSLLDRYYELLDDGYQRNWHQLTRYEMPISSRVNDAVWQIARDGGWWQRRVYDLALKMYFSTSEDDSFFRHFSPRIQEHIFVKPRSFI
jgi:hypothetical protein